MGCKQIVSEICLQGLTLPRLLKIPEPANAPETDILNIQFSVLDLLAMDSEIQPLTTNLWNLGFDISAFNTQKQAWDVLGVDTQVYLPEGARVKITLKTEESISGPPPRTRDPRKAPTATTIGAPLPAPLPQAIPTPPSRRDPRRKRVGVVAEQEGPRVARRDPRVKRNESEEVAAVHAEEPTEQTGNLLQSLKALPLPVDPEESRAVSVEVETESDSDEGNLQIDESFDEAAKTVKSLQEQPARSIIKETQLARIQTTEAPDDSAGLWDEIYGIANEDVKKTKVGSEQEPSIQVKRDPDEEEVTIVNDMNQLDLKAPSIDKVDVENPLPPLKIPPPGEKTQEQLETEKELLQKLVEERERLKATLAEAGVPDIPMEVKEVEEGELSDSSESEEEEAAKLKPDLFSPESPDPEPNINKSDFFSPESPKVIELDDEEEVHVIPLEREDEKVEDGDRFQKYWDEFPDEDLTKEKPRQEESIEAGNLRALVEKKIMEKVISEKKPELPPMNAGVSEKGSSEFAVNEAPSLSFWKGSTGLESNKDKERISIPDHRAFVGPRPPPPPPIRKFLLDAPPAPHMSPNPMFQQIPPKAPNLVHYQDLPDKTPDEKGRREAEGMSAKSGREHRKSDDERYKRRNNKDQYDDGWKKERRRRRRSRSSSRQRSRSSSRRKSRSSSRRRSRSSSRQRSKSSSRSRSRSRETGGSKSNPGQNRQHNSGSSWRSKEGSSKDLSRKHGGREKRNTRWEKPTTGEQTSVEAKASTSSCGSTPTSKSNEPSQEVSEKERHDKAMLCFYEGEDCLDDPGEAPLFPEPVPAVSKTPSVPPPLPNLTSTTPYPYFKPGGMDLTRVHPITAVHELCRRIGCGAPLWHERMVANMGRSAWAFDVTVAGVKYTLTGSAREKKDAQRDVARHCLAQLGIFSTYGK